MTPRPTRSRYPLHVPRTSHDRPRTSHVNVDANGSRPTVHAKDPRCACARTPCGFSLEPWNRETFTCTFRSNVDRAPVGHEPRIERGRELVPRHDPTIVARATGTWTRTVFAPRFTRRIRAVRVRERPAGFLLSRGIVRRSRARSGQTWNVPPSDVGRRTWNRRTWNRRT